MRTSLVKISFQRQPAAIRGFHRTPREKRILLFQVGKASLAKLIEPFARFISPFQLGIFHRPHFCIGCHGRKITMPVPFGKR